MMEPVRVLAAAGQPAFDCSVVIALYNKAPYIERAIRSVVRQTVAPREIIVVDDGSTDDGPQRVAALAETHPSLRLVRQSNGGVSRARNRGIAEASGAWVAFLDADDAYLPGFIEEMALLARGHPEAVFLGAHFQEVRPDFDLSEHGAGTEGDAPRRGIVPVFYDRWWRGNIVHTSSVCVRRDVLADLVEPFPAGENAGEDLDLFFRLAERGPLAMTSRLGALYAVGIPGSLTWGHNEIELLPCFQRLRSRIEQPDFPAGERPGARRCIATKLLVIARTRSRLGDQHGAVALLRDPITAMRPTYWLRTAAIVAGNALSQSIFRRAATLNKA